MIFRHKSIEMSPAEVLQLARETRRICDEHPTAVYQAGGSCFYHKGDLMEGLCPLEGCGCVVGRGFAAIGADVSRVAGAAESWDGEDQQVVVAPIGELLRNVPRQQLFGERHALLLAKTPESRAALLKDATPSRVLCAWLAIVQYHQDHGAEIGAARVRADETVPEALPLFQESQQQ